MMRLDHIAYRTKDRNKTADFFIKAFNYKIQTEFHINFDDGTQSKCIALEPPEKIGDCPWETILNLPVGDVHYHLAPEIFVSDGDPESIVGKWVAKRDGIGGLHHCAYLVNSVVEQVKLWKEKGYAEFTSEEPMRCENLVQVFTSPHSLTGMIYEFIERGKHGFCKENVKSLMISADNHL